VAKATAVVRTARGIVAAEMRFIFMMRSSLLINK
jgi:hypothetical protein